MDDIPARVFGFGFELLAQGATSSSFAILLGCLLSGDLRSDWFVIKVGLVGMEKERSGSHVSD